MNDIDMNLWFDKISTGKQRCRDGAEPGRWLVPCFDCGTKSSCVWSQIKWMAYDCQYKIPVSNERLKRCLQNKKVKQNLIVSKKLNEIKIRIDPADWRLNQSWNNALHTGTSEWITYGGGQDARLQVLQGGT